MAKSATGPSVPAPPKKGRTKYKAEYLKLVACIKEHHKCKTLVAQKKEELEEAESNLNDYEEHMLAMVDLEPKPEPAKPTAGFTTPDQPIGSGNLNDEEDEEGAGGVARNLNDELDDEARHAAAEAAGEEDSAEDEGAEKAATEADKAASEGAEEEK